MIKLNFLTVLLLFNFSLSAKNCVPEINLDSKVSIEILNIITNGQILPNNTISFNGIEDLEIEFDVKIFYTGINTKYTNEGILNCYYYEPNEFDNEIAPHYNNGVNSLYLFQKNDIKLELSNSSYTQTFHQKLRFKRSITFNSGSSFVFRYRTNTLSTDISNKLTFKLVGGTKTGKEPYAPSVANIKLTNLSYSDGSPIINNTIIIPDYTGNEIGSQTINLSFNFDCKYGSQLLAGYYPSYIIQIRHDEGYSTHLIPQYNTIMSTSSGTITINNLKINASDLRPNDHLRILFSFNDAKINLDWAIIKGYNEKPILNNIISDSQTLQYGQAAKPLTLCSSPYLDYSIYPTLKVRAARIIYDYRYITSFKWQIRTKDSNWSDIPGATSINYSPSKNFTENTYYRRLALNGTEQYSISNTVSILIENSSIKNSICCDQALPLKNSQPNQINGNDINSNNYNYQWQFAKNSGDNYYSAWQNITGITSQNYKHIYNEDAFSNSEKIKFRRILELNSLPINISNEVVISRYTVIDYRPTPRDGNTGAGRQSVKSSNSQLESSLFDINNLSIYPNPIINSFFIEGSININDINIYDSFGTKSNLEKYQISKDLIEVNTSRLQSGVFILKVDNTTFSKTLIKN